MNRDTKFAALAASILFLSMQSPAPLQAQTSQSSQTSQTSKSLVGKTCLTKSYCAKPCSTHTCIADTCIVKACSNESEEVFPKGIELDTIAGLLVKVPLQGLQLEFVTGERPSMDDTTIVLCVAAAFTKDRSGIVSESKICGIHTSSGKLYQGYPDKVVNGSVRLGAQDYEFAEGTRMDMAKAAQGNGESFFQQNLVIYEGKRHKPELYKNTNSDIYRCLCECSESGLCIIQGLERSTYGFFAQSLLKVGNVVNAVYLDMGGWRYSWYRKPDGSVVEFFPAGPDTKYQSNWLIARRY